MHNLDRILNSQKSFSETEFEAGPFGSEFEFEDEDENNGGAVMNEESLAAELLSVSNEDELEYFIGGLLKAVVPAVKNFAQSSAGKAIGGALKSAAKAALPTVGAALGSAIPIPGVGTAIGGMAGKALAQALEFEAGGGGADQEFEAAKQVVRLGAEAAKSAAQAPPGANPNAVAMNAVKSALRTIQGGGMPGAQGHGASGRWIRRGRQIVLFGV